MLRRILVLGLAVGAAALQIYLANIPRVVNMPREDVDEKISAKTDNERVEIDEPVVAPGDLLLSYSPNPDVSGRNFLVTDLHFENAIVDPSNARVQPELEDVKALAAKVSYVSPPPAGPAAALMATVADTCHTFVEIRRAKESGPIRSLNLYVINGSANNEQRRELRVWSEGGALEVTVHTDPPPVPADGKPAPLDSLPGCSKILQVRPLQEGEESGEFRLVPWPVRLMVPEAKEQKASNPANAFRIAFTPAFPAPLVWNSADDMFSGIALGSDARVAQGLQVLPSHAENDGRLELTAAKESNLVVDQLRFSLNSLRLRLSGRAWVKVDGKPLGFDLMRFLKENPITSGILTLLNGAVLFLVKKTFFRQLAAEPEAGES